MKEWLFVVQPSVPRPQRRVDSIHHQIGFMSFGEAMPKNLPAHLKESAFF